MIPDLIQQFDAYGEHVILNGSIENDGEGGFITVWSEGAHFNAAVMPDNSPEMKIAQAQGVKGIYTVTTDKPIRLPWHTVFRRVSDGQVFRITSKDETAAPRTSTIQTRIATAEEWELPADE